ncbi:16S rRNA (cytidine(1402)-2'-O)-methyltransferase [Xylocopilactobacillus apicola]|uniref:Ribosomal RNA small subunit methyltransferase I n=1 Tax=Xylocopilactobacillus apicola TaxID=2932184 RepID=A0AAU9DJU6_9LACO|nr:16S rRNA (cytidine(1402)-2'-O)-methyltransferase [Xylocopilactobacillus apicola]BDR58771.1 ribosomal RNA small subunit methyltransferase I [Xylocopilactobacillus apicola]
MNEKNSGTLFLIPTPIGNLDDLTFRALKILKQVDLLLCEDTRHTQILLDHYEIQVPKLSFHEHNSHRRIPEVVEKLKSGLNLGLVSDAGMPVISDPGVDLVQYLRKREIPVVALPGANAALTALVGSGMIALPYVFLGFLPRTIKEIKEVLNKTPQMTTLFYESPYRIVKTLEIISQIDENWELCIARELTKIHEEYFEGRAFEALEHFKQFPPKGEFVVILTPRIIEIVAPSEEKWQEEITLAIEAGDAPNLAIKNFAKKYNLERKIVYDVYHNLNR